MKKPVAPTLLLDIESQLASDSSGEIRKNIVKRLEAMREKLLIQQRSMNDRETYRRIDASISAVNGALIVLRTLKTGQVQPLHTLERTFLPISAFIKRGA